MAQAKPSRSYSPRTIKILFARSGNQCAFPECVNPVVVPEIEKSRPHVSAQICHILPASRERGPRAGKGLTDAPNEPDNLILLCPTHHGIVDGQHESYPPERLREWKRAHEAKWAELSSQPLASVRLALGEREDFDAKGEIEREATLLRQTRFYVDGNTVDRATKLGARIVRGDLAGAPARTKAFGLGWCARTLMLTAAGDKAHEFLDACEALPSDDHVEIARGFRLLAGGDQPAAMRRIAQLSTPASRSALFLVAAQKREPAEALDWLAQAPFTLGDMDADGKFAALTRGLVAERWAFADDAARSLEEADFVALPPLLHCAAIVELLPSVPLDLRSLIVTQPPFDVADFPLSSDTAAVERRRVAIGLFERSARAAEALACRNAQSIDDFFALWLELRDPSAAQGARGKLDVALRNAKTALGVVPLAAQFGIKLDVAAVEREIAQRTSIHGYRDYEAAVARFALAFVQPEPAAGAAYLARFRHEFAEVLDLKTVSSIEVQLLTEAGQIDAAQSRLNAIGDDALPPNQRGRLQAAIDRGPRDPDIDEAEREFVADDTTSTLARLVKLLEARSSNLKLALYARKLFERTRSLIDAERLGNVLAATEQDSELAAFFSEEASLVGQSAVLRAARAWHRYRRGDLAGARKDLAEVRTGRNWPGDRLLVMNIAVTSGAWEELAGLLEDEWRDRSSRTAQQLLSCAELAGTLDLARRRDFLFHAAAEAGDDPHLLAQCYFLASQFGFDNDPATADWLKRAAAHSGEDGPLQSMSLEEIVERQPAWNKQENDAWQQMRAGELPLFLGAKLLHRSLAELQLRALLRNRETADPRRRWAVPLYSGKREAVTGDPGHVAFDAGALLTLAYLDLVDDTLAAFERVTIPHSTMVWLLQERKRARFHQPTRIVAAHRLRDLLARGKLTVFEAGAVRDEHLDEIVGRNLAGMIEAAWPAKDAARRQRLVVRSLPIHRAGSLTGEHADLADHRARICSCAAVIDRLALRGQLSRAEEARARAYLRLHEEARDDDPVIDSDAELLLDDLSVSYLDHLGLLGRLADAGLIVSVSRREADEADGLIAYEQLGERVAAALDRLRSAIAASIEAGRVNVGPASEGHGEEAEDLSAYPIIEAMSLADAVDTIVIDDRAVNRHARIDGSAGSAKLWTTLDIIDHLRRSGALGEERWLDCRAGLRRGGALFLPVDQAELEALLGAAAIAGDALVETAELRAFREAILMARIEPWLALPGEAEWLNALLAAAARVARACWREHDAMRSTAIANWLMQFLDLRDWAHCFGEESAEIAERGRALGILVLLRTPDRLNEAQTQRLNAWLDDVVLAELEAEQPPAHAWLIETLRGLIETLVENEVTAAS